MPATSAAAACRAAGRRRPTRLASVFLVRMMGGAGFLVLTRPLSVVMSGGVVWSMAVLLGAARVLGPVGVRMAMPGMVMAVIAMVVLVMVTLVVTTMPVTVPVMRRALRRIGAGFRLERGPLLADDQVHLPQQGGQHMIGL